MNWAPVQVVNRRGCTTLLSGLRHHRQEKGTKDDRSGFGTEEPEHGGLRVTEHRRSVCDGQRWNESQSFVITGGRLLCVCQGR